MIILTGTTPANPPKSGTTRWKGPALFRRLPKWFYRANSDSIIDRAKLDDFVDLRDDLDFLAEVLEPEFKKCDIAALDQQNRYRRQQLVLLVAGAAGAILGAVQAALTNVAWPGVVLALVSAVSGVFAQAVARSSALTRYLDQRTRAERLRSLYFQYVTGIDRYTGSEREEQLRSDVEDVLTKDLT